MNSHNCAERVQAKLSLPFGGTTVVVEYRPFSDLSDSEVRVLERDYGESDDSIRCAVCGHVMHRRGGEDAVRAIVALRAARRLYRFELYPDGLGFDRDGYVIAEKLLEKRYPRWEDLMRLRRLVLRHERQLLPAEITALDQELHINERIVPFGFFSDRYKERYPYC
jgi:hypothetical protein